MIFFFLSLFLPWIILTFIKIIFLIIYHYQFKTETETLNSQERLKFLWNIKISNNDYFLVLEICAILFLPLVIMGHLNSQVDKNDFVEHHLVYILIAGFFFFVIIDKSFRNDIFKNKKG